MAVDVLARDLAVDVLPRDLAVPCRCGGTVPLRSFVVDGRPHDSAPCPCCGRTMFLSRPPLVTAR